MLRGRFAGSLRRLAGVCGAVALLSGCQPSMDEVVAEHRAAVESTHARIRALDPVVQALPPLAADRIDTGGQAVTLDGEDANALFVPAFNLSSPEYASSDGTGGTHARTLEACGEALRGDAMGLASAFAGYLQTCGRAEYLFVLRTMAEASAQIVDLDSFEPGLFEGEVLLFRLADGALLGGFRVAARSSDQVMAQADASGNATDIAERLESDLDSNVFVDIQDKLREHLPGSIR